MRLRLFALVLLLLGGAAGVATAQPAYTYPVGPSLHSFPVWIGGWPSSTSVDSLLYLSGTPGGVEYGIYSASTLPNYFAGNLSAKVVHPKILTVATLPTCNAALFGAIASITDGAGATDCTTGASTTDVACECNGSAWAARYTGTADTSAYVLITAAAQQSVTASGAGNDVTLTAADDVILVPADALTATVGGAVAVTTTAGAITLTAGGTTQDITLVSVDDIILTPADDLTANPTGLVNITPGESFAVTTTAGGITLTAGGTTQDISLISVDQVILDGEGGADEVTIDAGSTTIIGAFKLTASSAPPVACAAGTEGTYYVDSDIHKPCYCNGTAYVLASDDTTTTGCS